MARNGGLVWDWPPAALGAAYALPAAVVVLDNPSHGFALGVGVIPAAVAGIAPQRRGRLAIVVLGVLTGVPMFIGGLLHGVPVLAVAAIFGLGVGAALLAARSRLGMIAMTVSLPLVGIGLSYSDIGEAAALGALMIAGSIYACAICMLWPTRDAGPAQVPPPAAGRPTLGYGVRLGAAGATAAAIGFASSLEHVGWACAAALLVMRPAADMQRLRSVGRLVSVAVGALAAVALVRSTPAAGWYAAAVVVVVAGAAATHRSRWYVTPAFTTFLVFLLLLYSAPQTAQSRFNERLVETALGVGLAYLFGLGIPALLERRRA
jgi:fusaric acid resistance family protein